MPKFVILRIPGAHTDFRREMPIPNLGVGFLAAIAKEEGFSAAVLEGHMWLDMGYLPESLTYPERLGFFLREVEKESPDILGISVLSGDLALGIELAKIYKSKHPETFIIMGGVGLNGVTSIAARYASNSLDVIVKGEGEHTLKEILKEFKKGKKADFRGIKGLSYRDGNKWVHNPLRELIANLDSLPLITLADYKHLPPNVNTLLPIERGCPGNCRFCFATETWGIGRYFSLPRIKKQGEILLNFQRAGQTFFLSDSNIFADDRIGEETLRFVLKHFPQAVGGVNVRVDQITPRLIELFAEFPRISPLMGIEALSPHLLLYLGKTQHPAAYLLKTAEVLRKFRENKMYYCLSLIYHIPGETKEDLEKIYHFFAEQDKERCKLIYLSRLWLEGNTPLWQAYNRGELDIYATREPEAKILGEQYNDIIFEPFAYLFRNTLISDQEYGLFARQCRQIFRDSPCYYLG